MVLAMMTMMGMKLIGRELSGFLGGIEMRVRSGVRMEGRMMEREC